MTSDRQIAANRQNAQRSTGPRTPDGRAVSRQNALRHGVLCEHVTAGSENVERYNALLEDLRNELNPQGERECLLVERLANLFWRERRLIEAERRELNHQFEVAAHPFGEGSQSLSLGQQLLIGRYQTMLTNQILVTMNQLDLLQARREDSQYIE